MTIPNVLADLYVSKQMHGANIAHDIVNVARKQLKAHNLECTAFSITHNQFIELRGYPDINSFVKEHVLQNQYRARISHYPASYRTINDNTSRDRFYELIKVHHFMTEPFTGYKVPFSMGIINEQPHHHPGNTRFRCMPILPLDSKMWVMVTNLPINIQLLEKISKLEHADSFTFSQTSDTEIINKLDLCSYEHTTIWLSSTIGLQIMEQCSKLEIFNKRYSIKFTGKEFIVNGDVILYLDDNNEFRFFTAN